MTARASDQSLLCPRTVAGIDFLRGTFAIMVVIGHSVKAVREIHGPEFTATFGGRMLSATLEQALVWVIGFFVISGFCIQHSTAASLSSKGRPNVRHYFLARITRIYPFYVIALALAIAALIIRQSAELSLPKLAAALTVTQGVFGILSSFENSWSLTNEMFYYLVYGVLLAATKGDTLRILTWGSGIAVILTIAGLSLWVSTGRTSLGIFEYWTIPLQMLIWLGGVALLHFWQPLRRVFASRGSLLLLTVVSFSLVYFFYTRMWLHGVHLIEMQAINLAWLPFFCLLLLALPHLKSFDDTRARALCTSLGLLSYPLFLLHSPMQHIMTTMLQPAPWFQSISALAQGLLFAAMPLVLCWMLAVPAEARILRWRKQWLKQA